MTFVLGIKQYHCFCGNFLFNSGDFYWGNTEVYYWLQAYRDGSNLLNNRVFLHSPNLLECTECRKLIGAVVYPDGGLLEKLRFYKNKVYFKELFVVKENGSLQLE